MIRWYFICINEQNEKYFFFVLFFIIKILLFENDEGDSWVVVSSLVGWLLKIIKRDEPPPDKIYITKGREIFIRKTRKIVFSLSLN